MEKITKELMKKLADQRCTVIPESEWVPIRYSPEMQKRIDELKKEVQKMDFSKLPKLG